MPFMAAYSPFGGNAPGKEKIMGTKVKTEITVKTRVKAPVETAWKLWTLPEHVVQWNHASDDWHSPKAENDLRPGGKFNYRMEARDGSSGFDFWGIYDEIKVNREIALTLGDGRKVKTVFKSAGRETEITETFDAEGTNSAEMQRTGWQAILDNFRKYAERQ
jgi:uncharacterized protein YndB with AHSA1/START domain